MHSEEPPIAETSIADIRDLWHAHGPWLASLTAACGDATQVMQAAEARRAAASEANIDQTAIDIIGPLRHISSDPDYEEFNDLIKGGDKIIGLISDTNSSQPSLQPLPPETDYDFEYRENMFNSCTALDRDFIDKVATGRQEFYYFGTSSRPLFYPDGPVETTTHAPIGEYGAFSYRLLQTTHDMLQPLDNLGITSLHKTAVPHEQALQRTFWGEEDADPGDTLSTLMYESNTSLQQTVNILTAEYVDGFETGEALWQAIGRAGLLEQLTRLLWFGGIAPLAHGGLFIPGLVVRKRNTVELEADHVHELKQHQAQLREAYIARIESLKKENPSLLDAQYLRPKGEGLGLICPAAMPGGGLAERHSAFFKRHVELHKIELL